ncbi:hypothetical protein AJ80_06785 [Polytolypa hystricis UAMH7299]|uniref:Uncharacterized protein n=1 Tax=Polytolypa hystricis (strain UAMH7299) TaxID=1447883 RepID=A0A2B7XU26_POLH7|nr:hypothetical protein AJ80_06785 [Polytolypa hystricis UAMH7299]
MHFSTALLTTLLLSVTMVEGLKCACNAGGQNSKAACDYIGKVYGTRGCGYTGCCVFPGRERDAFENACNTLGFGFKRCDECETC